MQIGGTVYASYYSTLLLFSDRYGRCNLQYHVDIPYWQLGIIFFFYLAALAQSSGAPKRRTQQVSRWSEPAGVVRGGGKISGASVREGKRIEEREYDRHSLALAANERHFLCTNDVRFVQMPTNELSWGSDRGMDGCICIISRSPAPLVRLSQSPTCFFPERKKKLKKIYGIIAGEWWRQCCVMLRAPGLLVWCCGVCRRFFF